MAFDAFLYIKGIEGESTDGAHTGWIEVLSYSHGLSQPATARSAAGSAAGERCNHQDFSIVKVLDKTSPKLALWCCNGKHIPEVKLELCRATGAKQKYMEYRMEDVIVSGVRPGGSAHGGETLPLEEVSFNYGKITWAYTETDHETGASKGDVRANWDLKTNKGE